MPSGTSEAVGTATRALNRLSIANLVLAGLSLASAVLWLFYAGVESIAIIVSFMLVVASLSFMAARHALKSNRVGRWYAQVIGPSILAFIVFGSLAMVLVAATGVAIVWLWRRKAASTDAA
jgi:hypothetical protein